MSDCTDIPCKMPLEIGHSQMWELIEGVDIYIDVNKGSAVAQW